MKCLKYENPKNQIEVLPKRRINPRIACVMATYVPQDRDEDFLVLTNKQERNTMTENKFNSVRFTLDCFNYFRSGLNYDLFIVDSGSPRQEMTDFLKTLKYPVYYRENNGWSFGSYQWFWENVPETSNYDYFLFFEQDYCPAINDWLKKLFDDYVSDDAIGSLGNVVEERDCDDEIDGEAFRKQSEFLGINREKFGNLDGAYHFISGEILGKMKMKVIDCRPRVDVEESMNEILFEQPILEMGYSIVGYNDGNHIYFHGGQFVAEIKEELKHLKIPENLAPIIAGYTRFTCPAMKEYFSRVLKTYEEN